MSRLLSHFARGLLFGTLLLCFVLIALATTALLVWRWAERPLDSSTTESTKFIIPRGQAILTIGERLTEAGLIRHPQLFRFYVWRAQLGSRLQAGTFELSANQSLGEIALALTAGPEDVWLTIPEGLRREEVVSLLAQLPLEQFDPTLFLTLTETLEGRLFPDTYLLPLTISEAELVELFTRTFAQKITSPLSAAFESSSHSIEEILIMASLIQREAGSEAEMPAVAAVLWNRVALGMPLGVDATLQYLAGQNQASGKWWSSPDVAYKASESPYNTYRYQGLPPAPIASPGLAAVQAALAPATSDYLYYLHADGQIYFAKTLEEHTRNINRYLR